MGLDVLRCQSPHMIRRELWAGLLAYNLIRQTILETSARSGAPPRSVSFTAALQNTGANWTTVLALSESARILLIDTILKNLKHCRVGHRPGRVEPRAVKRRPKDHRLLSVPRSQARQDPSWVAGRKKGAK